MSQHTHTHTVCLICVDIDWYVFIVEGGGGGTDKGMVLLKDRAKRGGQHLVDNLSVSKHSGTEGERWLSITVRSPH